MSEINFCNTKEQLNHLGEVVTGKVDGSPSGADIDTSTLPYTGQVRKTLPALEGEYEVSIATKQAEADAAIDEYRLLNKGPYASGITLESKFEYITYSGESYFATNPPYTTTATTPDSDGNLFAGGYTTLETVANKISNPNLLSNSNFLMPSPDSITHPNATPESYVAGTQIFSGVYAGSSGVTVTMIDGRVNCSAGSYEYRVSNTNGLDRVPVFTSSVSDYDGNPVTTGVSHALVSDEYVVSVTPAAGDVFSVKFEQGDIATRHDIQRFNANVYTFVTVDEMTDCGAPVGSTVRIKNRANAPFTVVSGGSPDGFSVLDAGNGNTAVYDGMMITPLEVFGCISDLVFTTDENDVVLTESGTDNSDALQAAWDWSSENKAIITGSGNGYMCSTHGVIMKSGANYFGTRSTYFMQNYQVDVEPKSESLFRNESWNTELNTDKNIYLTGMSITNGSSVVGGSFITANKIEKYDFSDIYCRKFSENSAFNIGGKDFTLRDIEVVNLPTDTGKIDAIHFEYIEDCQMDNLNLTSQDDCLGFAYFPAIVPPRNPAEAIANVPWGRDLTSRNITVCNATLNSHIANGIRIGNWANFEDLNQYMEPDGRYENMTFSNITFNKTATTGTALLLEDYRHGATEIAQPHNELRFNNLIINDFTSDTESVISIRGNAFLRGFYDYTTAGDDRNFKNVYFNGISGTHASKGSTYDLNGASMVSMVDCKLARTVESNNELITQLVDSINLESSYINSRGETATANACFFRDFKEVIINGGKIEGNGSEVAAVRLQQPNVGNIGRVQIDGTVMRNVVDGLNAVSALELEQLTVNADMTGISGDATNSLLTSRSGNRMPLDNVNSDITVNNGECRTSGVSGVASFNITVNSGVALNAKIADFPDGCKPSHTDPIRVNIIDSVGTNHLIDYSSTVGMRVRASGGMPAGDYYINFAYRVKG